MGGQTENHQLQGFQTSKMLKACLLLWHISVPVAVTGRPSSDHANSRLVRNPVTTMTFQPRCIISQLNGPLFSESGSILAFKPDFTVGHSDQCCLSLDFLQLMKKDDFKPSQIDGQICDRYSQDKDCWSAVVSQSKNLQEAIGKEDKNMATRFSENLHVVLQLLRARCGDELKKNNLRASYLNSKNSEFSSRLKSKIGKTQNEKLNNKSINTAFQKSMSSTSNILSDDDFCQRSILSNDNPDNVLARTSLELCDNMNKYKKHVKPGAYCSTFNTGNQIGLCDLFENCVQDGQGLCQSRTLVNIKFAIANQYETISNLIKDRVLPFRGYGPGSLRAAAVKAGMAISEKTIKPNPPQQDENIKLSLETTSATGAKSRPLRSIREPLAPAKQVQVGERKYRIAQDFFTKPALRRHIMDMSVVQRLQELRNDMGNFNKVAERIGQMISDSKKWFGVYINLANTIV